MHEDGPGPFQVYRDTAGGPNEQPPGLAIGGEIDEDAYHALVEKLGELSWGRDEVHIDLTAVQYCDLAGLRAIVRPATTGRTVVLHG